jgi:hypothetical protein
MKTTTTTEITRTMTTTIGLLLELSVARGSPLRRIMVKRGEEEQVAGVAGSRQEEVIPEAELLYLLLLETNNY